MQIFAAALLAVLLLIHALLWLDEGGVRQMQALRVALQAQVAENAELSERNRGLDAEVKDLKSGLTALEERARAEMGLVRPDETFFRLLESPATPRAPEKSSTAKTPPKPKPVEKTPLKRHD